MPQYTQEELARRFATGETIGQASNITIRQFDDGTTALVGYGWATYAERSPSGKLTLFEGWRGYSVSTTCQLTRIKNGVIAAGVKYTVDDSDPKTGSRPYSSSIERPPIRA